MQLIKNIYASLRQRYYETIDAWYDALFNKYNFQPCGLCPVQAWGNLPTGEFYYFRSRHTAWYVRIAKSENELWDIKAVWIYGEEIYEEYEGGCISNREAIKNFNKAVKKYYNEYPRS